MIERPRAKLGRILDDLGSTLLELVCGDPDASGYISGVVIHDPYDEPQLTKGTVVLGVGVHDPQDVAALLEWVGDQGAAALVIRAPVVVDDAVRAAAERAGTAVLGLTRGASWTRLAALLRSLLAEGDIASNNSEDLGSFPAGDLFAMANAVSALLGAAVTIEDRNSRVLAFSELQDEADESRVETVLGRQVPERYTLALQESGFFQHLYRSTRPAFLDPTLLHMSEVTMPRVAIAVRAGDEVLGSMWAAVPEQLSVERERAFVGAAKLIALQILRDRAGADVDRRLHADLIATVLEGGPNAREAASRLALATQSCVVVAVALDGDPSGVATAQRLTDRQRLASAFGLHMSTMHPGSSAALVGGVVYGLLPVANGKDVDEEAPLRAAQRFLERSGDRINCMIGIGRPARELADLPRSRTDADRVLRVLRSSHSGRRIAQIGDVKVEVLMQLLGDIEAAEGPGTQTGAIARLQAHDAQHGTDLVDALRAWLDAFGNVNVAASAVHVHPNTFRYRMRRLSEIGDLDLNDPEARFAFTIQLRLMQQRD